MNLSSIKKTTSTGKRRLGQGHGSGRVKTAGRGTKGQQARRNIPLFFEGGALPLIKRLPFLRGKGRNTSFRGKPEVVNIESLNKFSKNAVVDVKSLAEQRLIKEDKASKFGVKILGDGEISVPLVIKLPVSKKAQAKIEKAGGRIELSK